jgi:cation diffusion facilitator CzcD-associated flavoprotein CzcO
MTRVAVIGAGFSGLAMGKALQTAGIDFTIYEKADDVGGTWRDNRYPGLTCDVPSRYYQLSFAKSADWEAMLSKGPDIHRYIKTVVAEHGLDRHIALGERLDEATWTDGRWELRFGSGRTDTVDVVVQATGVLHHPKIPDFPGAETFEGPAFHSARWDHTVQTRGKRVGVIGVGSTGCQIIGALAGEAAQVDVFQRSPDWVVTPPSFRYTRFGRAIQGRFPAARELSYRVAWYLSEQATKATTNPGVIRRLVQKAIRWNVRHAVKDPELRRKLTPDWEPLCKRLVVAPAYFKAIQRPDVALITDAIDRIEPTGIRTADGTLHELDVIVYATGFDAARFMRPMTITGADGATLEEFWAGGPRAYRSVAMPGFPNMFLVMGPNSPVGNNSLIRIAEDQVGWISRWIDRIDRGEIGSVAPTAAATDAFYEKVAEATPDTVWSTGCASWYHNPDGSILLWPWTPMRFREVLRAEPDLRDFVVQPATARRAEQAAA